MKRLALLVLFCTASLSFAADVSPSIPIDPKTAAVLKEVLDDSRDRAERYQGVLQQLNAQERTAMDEFAQSKLRSQAAWPLNQSDRDLISKGMTKPTPSLRFVVERKWHCREISQAQYASEAARLDAILETERKLRMDILIRFPRVAQVCVFDNRQFWLVGEQAIKDALNLSPPLISATER